MASFGVLVRAFGFVVHCRISTRVFANFFSLFQFFGVTWMASFGVLVRVFGHGVLHLLGVGWRSGRLDLMLWFLGSFSFGGVSSCLGEWEEFFCDIFGLFIV